MKLQDFDFRVWDNVNKKFFKNPCVAKPFKKDKFIFGELIIVTSSKEFKQIIGDFEIEFYTGKKDCNGKKIYEGDIIEITDTKDIYVRTAKVIFNSLGFLLEIGSNLSDYYHRRYIIEVIGNIHEDKDLNYDLVKKRLCKELISQ